MNLVRSLIGAALTPARPLHAGEAMTLWSILAALQDGRGVAMGLLHHTSDSELKRYIEQHISDFDDPWIKRVKEFMLEHRISPPPPSSDKPVAKESDIPPGAKFTDIEIAEMLVVMFRNGLQLVQHGTLECLNYDMGALLLQMEADGFRDSLMLREMMEKRGWLKAPPQWHPPGANQ